MIKPHTHIPDTVVAYSFIEQHVDRPALARSQHVIQPTELGAIEPYYIPVFDYLHFLLLSIEESFTLYY